MSSPAWLGSHAEIADSRRAHYLSPGTTDMTKTHVSQADNKRQNTHMSPRGHTAVPRRDSIPWGSLRYDAGDSCVYSSQYPGRVGLKDTAFPSPLATVTAVFLFALPLPRLQPCAEAVWLTEISRKLIVFHIQTWLPAQAQECQNQHKRKAKPMRLGEEKGGSSPVPVYISAAHPDTVQWALLQNTLDKASVHTWPWRQGSAHGFQHSDITRKHTLC